MDNARCIILVPIHHNVEPHCELALRQLETNGYTVRRYYGQAAVDQARNRLATDAVNEGFEELMWIDGSSWASNARPWCNTGPRRRSVPRNAPLAGWPEPDGTGVKLVGRRKRPFFRSSRESRWTCYPDPATMPVSCSVVDHRRPAT
ncbi:MAG: hypothetical protein K2R98_20620 [Gemmataceae bacterium]|nr:hypothetical protein [Gemmataceae bacterium]